MDTQNETERTERLRNQYATLAEDVYYRRNGQIRVWIRAGAERVDQSLASLYDRFILRLYRHYAPLWRLRWSLYYPWSSQNRKVRELERAEKRLQQLCDRQGTTDNHLQLAKGKGASRSPFFTKLPLEIRKMILVEAFGNQTIHLDLSLRHPFHEMKGKPKIINGNFYIFCAHAKIRPSSFENYSVDMVTISEELTYDTTKRKEWTWLSCVCHRQPPTAQRLSFGRRQNVRGSAIYEPEGDRCLEGRGYCPMWPGDWPRKCFVGVYGWLLSCRQAYMETHEILFKSNTFFISSPALLLGIQDILSPNIIGMMASLDVIFDGTVDINEAFTHLPSRFGIKSPHETGEFTFPSMQQLRISFRDTRQFTDPWTGEYLAAGGHRQFRRTITEGDLPEFDTLIPRIVPPSAEVTITCSHASRYFEIQNNLVAQQGHHTTQPQRAEFGGERCWRQIPKTNTENQENTKISTEGLPMEPLIAGYWIHSSNA